MMEIREEVKTIVEKRYVTSDGKEFTSRTKAEAHEAELSIAEAFNFDKLNNVQNLYLVRTLDIMFPDVAESISSDPDWKSKPLLYSTIAEYLYNCQIENLDNLDRFLIEVVQELRTEIFFVPSKKELSSILEDILNGKSLRVHIFDLARDNYSIPLRFKINDLGIE